MAFTEFYCKTGGSNMNGGRLNSGSEPSTSPAYSATNGGWNSGTGVFTPTSGDPSATVTVGDFASVFLDGATTPVFISRVTAVSSTTVTVSTTAKGGTAPTTAGSGISINVGGAWLGPNAAVSFPFNFATGAMTNAAGNQVRVNLKNSATYNITAAMTHTVIGPVTFQGYTSTPGDLGKATIDGGTSGASYTMLSLSSNGIDRTFLTDLIFQNNGATGSAAGLAGIGDTRTTLLRVVVNNVRGEGFNSPGIAIECEAYACNQNNSSNSGGFALMSGSLGRLIRCISHDNAGSNNNGFYEQGGGNILIDCIADSNGLHGLLCNNITRVTVIGCDFYNNVGSGIHSQTGTMNFNVSNSNFVSNGAYGINLASGGAGICLLLNNGYHNNTTAPTNGLGAAVEVGAVTLGAVPYVDAPNGDFRINLAAAKGAGRGAFTQTAASYAGTVGYPDIGAAQHQETGGGGGGGQRVIGG